MIAGRSRIEFRRGIRECGGVATRSTSGSTVRDLHHRQLWQYLPRAYVIPATTSPGMLHAVVFVPSLPHTVVSSGVDWVRFDRILFRVSIRERPTHSNDRSVFGHLGVRLYRRGKNCG